MVAFDYGRKRIGVAVSDRDGDARAAPDRRSAAARPTRSTRVAALSTEMARGDARPAAIVIGLPLTVRRHTSRADGTGARVRRRAVVARPASPSMYQDERLSSHEAESGSRQPPDILAAPQGDCWTRRPRPSSSRTTSTHAGPGPEPTARIWSIDGHECSAGSSCSWRSCWSFLPLRGAAAWIAGQRLAGAIQGVRRLGAVRRPARRDRPQAIGRALVAAGIVRDPVVFRVALWLSGSARRLKAGEYRFDRPMTPGDGDREDRRRRRVPPLHHVPRRADDPGDGPQLRGARVRRRCLVRGDRGGRRSRRRSRSRRHATWKATCSRRRMPEAARRRRASSWPMMVARFRTVVEPELLREARARGLSVRQLVTLASIVEKEASDSDERPRSRRCT